MEIGGEVDGSGEYPLLVLTLTFAKELFPPFTEVLQGRLIVDQYLDRFPLSVEDVAQGSILLGFILSQIRGVVELHGCCGPF